MRSSGHAHTRAMVRASDDTASPSRVGNAPRIVRQPRISSPASDLACVLFGAVLLCAALASALIAGWP